MLEKHSYQDQRPTADDSAQALSPSYFFEILKRRALYFSIPFLLVAFLGLLVTVAWPARYLSQGTILVEAQAIPTDFVRPTVAALANDRIQLIEQRIMTRDNLLEIAKKYNLTLGWQERASGTEIVDFIKARTLIAPSELKLNKMATQQGRQKNAVAFAVGFEYENPQIATLVANELVTMILKEDVRLRTNDATETTRFLDREVKRLEAQLNENDAQIVELQRRTGATPLDDASDLARLKAELLFKSATYSENHPDILALKRKIAALQKLSAPTKAKTGDQPPDAVGAVGNAVAPGLDTLETKRKSLKDELSKATEKLSAARLGESLERGQQSERLEVIEQPTLPTQPKSPNRPKLFAVVMALSLMLGGGVAGAAEMFDQSVRRSTDLYSLVDSHLVVSIPYISTRREVHRRKTVIIATSAVSAVLVIAILIALFFLLPPLDILFNKVMTAVFR